MSSDDTGTGERRAPRGGRPRGGRGAGACRPAPQGGGTRHKGCRNQGGPCKNFDARQTGLTRRKARCTHGPCHEGCATQGSTGPHGQGQREQAGTRASAGRRPHHESGFVPHHDGEDRQALDTHHQDCRAARKARSWARDEGRFGTHDCGTQACASGGADHREDSDPQHQGGSSRHQGRFGAQIDSRAGSAAQGRRTFDERSQVRPCVKRHQPRVGARNPRKDPQAAPRQDRGDAGGPFGGNGTSCAQEARPAEERRRDPGRGNRSRGAARGRSRYERSRTRLSQVRWRGCAPANASNRPGGRPRTLRCALEPAVAFARHPIRRVP